MQVVYSKYAGTELEFDGSNHLILKEDDVVGILETEDVKDLKPLNDRVLIKVRLQTIDLICKFLFGVCSCLFHLLSVFLLLRIVFRLKGFVSFT